jgi:hypothetical protein
MTLDHRAGLYEACLRISPIHPDHATMPIREGFDWSSCLAGAAFDRLYLVVFRSVRRATTDLELLREQDDRAYAEALEAGGLLRYFRGSMNERRECLSFCLWESREQAWRAAGGASHREAVEITSKIYRAYVLERYDLIRDEEGGLVFHLLAGDSSREDAPCGPARELQETGRGLAM